MSERWRRALARLDELEPDERALRRRAEAGPPITTQPSSASPNRLIVTLVALIVAIVPLVVVIIAFRSDPSKTIGAAPQGPEGLIAYAGVSDARWVLFTVRPDGSGNAPLPIADLPDDLDHPAWSPDGRRIAFDTSSGGPSSEEGGNRDVYVVDADGSNVTRLTTEDGWDYQPAWSPDGSRIAFVRSRPNEDIWVMNIDGGGLRRLTDGASFDLSPTWSPDGNQLAFVSNRSGSPEIYTMAADGGDVTRVTHNTAFEGSLAWSPDGSRIAFAGDVAGPGLYVMSIDGSQVTRMTEAPHVGPIEASWSPDGSVIAYVSRRDPDATASLQILDLTSGELTPIVSGTELCCPSWSRTSAISSSVASSEEDDPGVPESPPGAGVPTEPTATLLVSTRGPSGDDALLVGSLAVRNGCVGVGNAGAFTYLIWPTGSSLVPKDGGLVLTDGSGADIASIGDTVRMGGGVDVLGRADAAVVGGIPPACQEEGEHYWYVGQIERVTDPGPSPVPDRCTYPAVIPTSLPWLDPGEDLPAPTPNKIYNRLTWEGPDGEWAGSYVALRVLEKASIRDGKLAAPPLPDGTRGEIIAFNGEWDLFWSPSDRYCGSLALYVFLRGIPADEARVHAEDIARSLVERPGPMEAP